MGQAFFNVLIKTVLKLVFLANNFKINLGLGIRRKNQIQVVCQVVITAF